MADEIRRGYEFASKEEKFWEALAEGQGVVVIGVGTRGFRACSNSWDANFFEGEDNLRKNLTGADWNYEGNAFLVIKEKGKLIWRTKKELDEIKQKKAATILPVKRKQLDLAGVC